MMSGGGNDELGAGKRRMYMTGEVSENDSGRPEYEDKYRYEVSDTS